MLEVEPQSLEIRPFQLFDKQWAILVGGRERHNPMTVSWGGMGTLWNRPIVTVYVRPTRYTFECLASHAEFTLNFLDAAGRTALEVCGTVTGRDKNKWELAKLTPEPSKHIEVPRVSGAKLVFECRVLSHVDLDAQRFLESSLDKLYPQKDYHRVYFGEVLGIFRDEASGSDSSCP